MSYCFNPDCQQPQNSVGAKSCQSCGSSLLIDNRYRAVRAIGVGSFGRTFLAVDETNPLKNSCVIKQFFPQLPNLRHQINELFFREAIQLDELGTHPQIPELIDYLEHDKILYIVQTFIDGQNLEQELAAEGAFNESKIRHLLRDLLSVLQFLHENHVIHRDIKPTNIIRRGSDGKLVLVDFGTARYVTGTFLARTGTVIGSAAYIAPEQLMGKAVYASDLYSLGVSCIHLLTQIHPFDLYSFSEDAWVWRDFLCTPVSDSLEKILDRLLERATKRRYQSAVEVLQDLQVTDGGWVELTLIPSSEPSPNNSPNSQTSVTSVESPQSVTSIQPASVPIATPVPEKWEVVQVLQGHQGTVNALAFSADGRILATGGEDKTIKLWQVADDNDLHWEFHPLPIQTLEQRAVVWSIALTPDGRRLIGNCSDNTIRVRCLDTQQVIHCFDTRQGGFSSMAMSPDGKMIAIASSNDSVISLRDLETGELIRPLLSKTSGVMSMAFSGDGKRLAMANRRYHKITIWDVNTGEQIRTLSGHSQEILSVALNFTGSVLVSSSQDNTTKLWWLDLEKSPQILNKGRVACLAFSPDGQTIAGGDWFWAVGSDRLLSSSFGIYSRYTQTTACGVAFSPTGQLVATGGFYREVLIWRGT